MQNNWVDEGRAIARPLHHGGEVSNPNTNTPCKTCGGSGDPLHIRTDADYKPNCPDCHGDGIQPTESFEDQVFFALFDEWVCTAKMRGELCESCHARVELAKRRIIAAHQATTHHFTEKSVDMGEWTKILIYCTHCGLTPEKLRVVQATTDQRVAEARLEELQWVADLSFGQFSRQNVITRIASLTKEKS